jgi:hypothetical protein
MSNFPFRLERYPFRTYNAEGTSSVEHSDNEFVWRRLLPAFDVEDCHHEADTVAHWRAFVSQPNAVGEVPLRNLPNSKSSHWGTGVTAEEMHKMTTV